jgi:hypothetical protein
MLNNAKAKNAETLEAAMAVLNDPSVAYVKGIDIDGERAYAIHASDGAELAIMADRETAFAAAMTNDYLPVSVH